MAKKKPETKKQNPEKKKKKLITKNKKKLKKTLALLSSDSDSDSETLQNLLEPYSKSQLIDFLASAAASDTSLSATIRAAADRDVSHRKIFVHGLGWDATKETLSAVFGAYGGIEDCNVIVDRVTGKSKGYGFVLFGSRKGAEKALKEPRKKIGNRMASCQLSSVGSAAVAAAATTKSQPDGMARKIYVSNVPVDADPEKLRNFFSKFGEIETGPLGFDFKTGKSRGFALFVYKTVESAKKALREQYKAFNGHQLRCQQATESKNKSTVSAVSGGAATITMAVQPLQPPVLAAMAAAQNMAMMSQQYQYPNLNPLYSGLIANPLMAAHGHIGSGQVDEYGANGLSQVGKLGGGLGSSVLGAYGASGPSQLGLQHGQLGPSARTPGAAGGSYSGLTNPSIK